MVVEEEPAEVEEEEEFSCPKCKSTFTTQLELASHMTNVNCKPIMTPKCLLCDIGKKHALKKYDQQFHEILWYKKSK